MIVVISITCPACGKADLTGEEPVSVDSTITCNNCFSSFVVDDIDFTLITLPNPYQLEIFH